MTYPHAVYTRRDDAAVALADWQRTPWWRWRARRSHWRLVEILTDDLARLVLANGGQW